MHLDKSDLTVAQVTDLICYMLRCVETQLQPEDIIIPPGAEHLIMPGDEETVNIWMVDGWPHAAAIPECNWKIVLSGVPVNNN